MMIDDLFTGVIQMLILMLTGYLLLALDLWSVWIEIALMIMVARNEAMASRS